MRTSRLSAIRIWSYFVPGEPADTDMTAPCRDMQQCRYPPRFSRAGRVSPSAQPGRQHPAFPSCRSRVEGSRTDSDRCRRTSALRGAQCSKAACSRGRRQWRGLAARYWLKRERARSLHVADAGSQTGNCGSFGERQALIFGQGD